MTDEEKIAAFIAAHGVTKLDPADEKFVCNPAYMWCTATPGYLQEEAALPPEYENTMRRLARARIAQSLQFLGTRGGSNVMEQERYNVKQWIEDPRSDCAAWCMEAGIAITLVRRRAKEIIERGDHRFNPLAARAHLHVTIAKLTKIESHDQRPDA